MNKHLRSVLFWFSILLLSSFTLGGCNRFSCKDDHGTLSDRERFMSALAEVKDISLSTSVYNVGSIHFFGDGSITFDDQMKVVPRGGILFNQELFEKHLTHDGYYVQITPAGGNKALYMLKSSSVYELTNDHIKFFYVLSAPEDALNTIVKNFILVSVEVSVKFYSVETKQAKGIVNVSMSYKAFSNAVGVALVGTNEWDKMNNLFSSVKETDIKNSQVVLKGVTFTESNTLNFTTDTRFSGHKEFTIKNERDDDGDDNHGHKH